VNARSKAVNAGVVLPPVSQNLLSAHTVSCSSNTEKNASEEKASASRQLKRRDAALEEYKRVQEQLKEMYQKLAGENEFHSDVHKRMKEVSASISKTTKDLRAKVAHTYAQQQQLRKLRLQLKDCKEPSFSPEAAGIDASFLADNSLSLALESSMEAGEGSVDSPPAAGMGQVSGSPTGATSGSGTSGTAVVGSGEANTASAVSATSATGASGQDDQQGTLDVLRNKARNDIISAVRSGAFAQHLEALRKKARDSLLEGAQASNAQENVVADDKPE